MTGELNFKKRNDFIGLPLALVGKIKPIQQLSIKAYKSLIRFLHQTFESEKLSRITTVDHNAPLLPSAKMPIFKLCEQRVILGFKSN